MHHAKRRLLRNAAKVFDILAALASFAVSTWGISATTSLTLPEFLALRVRLDNCVLFAIIVSLTLVALRLRSLGAGVSPAAVSTAPTPYPPAASRESPP